MRWPMCQYSAVSALLTAVASWLRLCSMSWRMSPNRHRHRHPRNQSELFSQRMRGDEGVHIANRCAVAPPVSVDPAELVCGHCVPRQDGQLNEQQVDASASLVQCIHWLQAGTTLCSGHRRNRNVLGDGCALHTVNQNCVRTLHKIADDVGVQQIVWLLPVVNTLAVATMLHPLKIDTKTYLL